MERLFLIAVLVVLGGVWGVTVPLSKIAVSTGYQPFGIVLWQIIFSGSFLSLFMFYRRLRVKLKREHYILFVAVILAGTIVPGAFSFVAAYHLPAGVVAIVFPANCGSAAHGSVLSIACIGIGVRVVRNSGASGSVDQSA
jgi:drug/metabolite transporter (DMT)-like permease